MKNACTISPPAYGLKCYVGLGNTSELKKQKVVECPEEKHYVCMKMYGGGMGDQVRRKCHLINSVSYSFKSHPMYIMCMLKVKLNFEGDFHPEISSIPYIIACW